jgi:hypothetical protein
VGPPVPGDERAPALRVAGQGDYVIQYDLVGPKVDGVVPRLTIHHHDVVGLSCVGDELVVERPPIAGPVGHRGLAECLEGKGEYDPATESQKLRRAQCQKVGAARRRADQGGRFGGGQKPSDCVADRRGSIERKPGRRAGGIDPTSGQAPDCRASRHG